MDRTHRPVFLEESPQESAQRRTFPIVGMIGAYLLGNSALH